MTIVHVNTELRLAWRGGLEAALRAHTGEVAPYKILRDVVRAVSEAANKHLHLFNFRKQHAPAGEGFARRDSRSDNQPGGTLTQPRTKCFFRLARTQALYSRHRSKRPLASRRYRRQRARSLRHRIA